MVTHDAAIRVGTPGDTTVRVDGHELTDAVRALSIDAVAGARARLTLDLLVHPIEVDGEMTVGLPGQTYAALIALGWTPPATAPIDAKGR
jgi:hypothetical protein